MSVQKKTYYVYMLASRPYGALYIGVTSNLHKRVYQHREGFYNGFSKKYFTYILVYYESYGEIGMVLQREKRLKKWNRQWKIELIITMNPHWRDLYSDFEY